MTDVVEDFDKLYTKIQKKFILKYVLHCNSKEEQTCTIKQLHDRKSYFCCAINSELKCVLHKCVLVIIGTELDKSFRPSDTECVRDVAGTFIIDGRHLSFPNILMNNNILTHNFYDKMYSKNCKRIFYYGNFDDEKKINRAIQLVYDDCANVLYARDVYAKDFEVDEKFSETLAVYLKKSGKWNALNFLFDYDHFQVEQLVNYIKHIMCTKISYGIDSLSNKIIYKAVYLIELLYMSILNNYTQIDCDAPPIKRKKTQNVLFLRESKKIVDTIVNGKLIYVVSKTFSKQKKNYINYQDNSSNNNIEITPPVLKYRIGNEVVRITNDSMRQDMLMQQLDFVKFVDSFFHGEMTVAGKKFFLCRNVTLPDVNYNRISEKFMHLVHTKLIERITPQHTLDDKNLMIAFNNRPTAYCCNRNDLCKIFYNLKHQQSPIELKLLNNILFVNHHEGMICIKRCVELHEKNTDENVRINVLLTPFEYHNSESLLQTTTDVGTICENDDVRCLMSKLVQYYYKDYIRIFSTIPVPKLIVSLTNLKNAMPIVLKYDTSTMDLNRYFDTLSYGNSVSAPKHMLVNNKMFKLWTLVRDHKLLTAEDPYIPHCDLPIILYNNKVNKLKGKILCAKHENYTLKYNKSKSNNYAMVDGGNVLYIAGVLVCSVKIAWIYDGKRYKIESCKNQNYFVYKIFVYFRQIKNQIIQRIDSNMNIINDVVHVKLNLLTSTTDLQGIKICGIHGQKGVINGEEDLSNWRAEDGTHAQICLSPVSYLSRQSNFEDVETKYVYRDKKRYPIYNIPYMFFNNTPSNIYKEFLKINHTGHEKLEGTRLDQWTINQSFAGNRWAESLQYIRNGSNMPGDSGEYKVVTSLIHCTNSIVI
ncbi:LEF-8 [Urbanus proteus nucleopolyhedrovirus]|uniref:DNA-directed RNA polymerase n=1 Tax=Urbanus proteus nucleopolyhedrovirus TaxID=1675866 RepID=A0A162GUI1_9ABAC|nr:LEF-8 [Urbanus proteus nucleopolyhedrovirus]AKR17346.1 LEF-8 [Urbanus proteus nucleopolyhedrovirus]